MRTEEGRGEGLEEKKEKQRSRGVAGRGGESVVYWYSFSNPRTKCIHCDNCLVIMLRPGSTMV